MVLNSFFCHATYGVHAKQRLSKQRYAKQRFQNSGMQNSGQCKTAVCKTAVNAKQRYPKQRSMLLCFVLCYVIVVGFKKAIVLCCVQNSGHTN
jgi:hypothetical protein